MRKNLPGHLLWSVMVPACLSFTRAFVILSVFLYGSAYPQKKLAEFAGKNITADSIRSQVEYLASDAMGGRRTPSRYLDSAAAYIARQFQSYGLSPVNGSFFQPFDFCEFDLGPGSRVELMKGSDTARFTLPDEFIPYDFSGPGPATGDLVFAGYGITAPEYDYDDYKGIDVRGKIVVVLRLEPGQVDSAGQFVSGSGHDDRRDVKDEPYFKGSRILTVHSGLKDKYQNASDHGAIGLIIISGPLNFASLKPVGSPWPALSAMESGSRQIVYCSDLALKIPMIHGGEPFVNTIFGSVDTLLRIQQRIEQSGRPQSYLLPGISVFMKISYINSPIPAVNVAAFIKGSDDKKSSEVVIIGAHYDHVGMEINSGGRTADSIYNGADDNVSGTSGLLAVARAYSLSPGRPKRSVLFIAFAGEETGLLGSLTYVRNPLFPLSKTIAMLNLDMIGRNNPDSLFVLGARQNPGLARFIRKANRYTGFALRESKGIRMPGGSDHLPFYQEGISSIFLFAGLHKDYHQVTDEAIHLNYTKIARVARLTFLTSWAVAESGGKSIRIEAEQVELPGP